MEVVAELEIRDFGDGTSIGKIKIVQSGKVEFYFSVAISNF